MKFITKDVQCGLNRTNPWWGFAKDRRGWCIIVGIFWVNWDYS